MYQLIIDSLDAASIADICKDRILSNFRTLVVCDDPHVSLAKFKEEWKSAHQEFSKERALEQDSMYTLHLTRYVTRMQQMQITDDKDCISPSAIIFTNASEDIDQKFDIVIAVKPKIELAKSLIVSTTGQQLTSMAEANQDYSQIIRNQVDILQNLNIEPQDLITGEVVDSKILGQAMQKLKEEPMAVSQLCDNQKLVKKLRIVAGRAADQGLDSQILDQLHGLKVLLANLMDFNGNLSVDQSFTDLSDYQMFDDPFDIRQKMAISIRQVILEASY